MQSHERLSVAQLIQRHRSERLFAQAPLEESGLRTLSFEELATATNFVAHYYQQLGLEPGNRVGLLVAKPLDFVIHFLGGIAAGYWMAPLDPTLDYEALPSVDGHLAALELTAVVADRPRPHTSQLPWHVAEVSHRDEGFASNDGGILLSSSGTTGTPKTMLLSQDQILATATNISRHNALTSDDIGLNPLPLWHINAEVVAVLASVVAGSQLVLQRRFKRTDFWKLVRDVRATWINAVPAIVSHLSTLRDGEDVPDGVRFIRSASAPLPAEIIRDFEATIGIPIIESYGMTEAASQICANPLDGIRKAGSVGLPIGVDLQCLPFESDEVLSSDEAPRVGHIAIRGPSVISHYATDAHAHRFTDDGWLLTGDLGYLDEDGYVFLVGRIDDVINRSGEKIYPREIEEVILRVDGVVASAVIGLPHPTLGAVPLAFVELDATSDEQRRVICREIAHVLEGSLGRSKRPTAIRVVDVFARHATGKILRQPLRQADVNVLHEELLS